MNNNNIVDDIDLMEEDLDDIHENDVDDDDNVVDQENNFQQIYNKNKKNDYVKLNDLQETQLKPKSKDFYDLVNNITPKTSSSTQPKILIEDISDDDASVVNYNVNYPPNAKTTINNNIPNINNVHHNNNDELAMSIEPIQNETFKNTAIITKPQQIITIDDDDEDNNNNNDDDNDDDEDDDDVYNNDVDNYNNKNKFDIATMNKKNLLKNKFNVTKPTTTNNNMYKNHNNYTNYNEDNDEEDDEHDNDEDNDNII